jgi:hypothetical protein
MKRLFALEFARLSKQTSTWVIFTIIFLLGGFNVLLARLTAYPNFEGELVFFLNARFILESSFQLGQVQVLLIGVLTSLFIATDISQGTIRNKIIAGYSKFEIYLVQMVMSTVIATIGLLLFHALPSIFSPVITFPITQDDGGSFANFFIHMGFGYFLIISGVLLTTWLALKSKSTAGAIIFTLLVFVLGPTLTTIMKSIIEGIVLVNFDQFSDYEGFLAARQSIDQAFEFIYFYQLNRLANIGSLFDIINQPGSLNFFHPDTSSYIWKTILLNLTMMTLIIGVGGRGFARSDLR